MLTKNQCIDRVNEDVSRHACGLIAAQKKMWEDESPTIKGNSVEAYGIELECYRMHSGHEVDSSAEEIVLATEMLLRDWRDLANSLCAAASGPVVLSSAMQRAQELRHRIENRTITALRPSDLAGMDPFSSPSSKLLIDTLALDMSSPYALAQTQMNAELPSWTWKSDNSVPNTADEIVSPRLRGQVDMAQVEVACTILSDNKFELNHKCGTHVSHEAPESSMFQNAIGAIFAKWYELEAPPPGFRMGSKFDDEHDQAYEHEIGYCQAPTATSSSVVMFALENSAASAADRSGLVLTRESALNLTYSTTGRVEMRAWEGTLDALQIKRQVAWGQELMDRAISLTPTMQSLRRAVRDAAGY